MRSFRGFALVLAMLGLGAAPALAQGDMQFSGVLGLGWAYYLLPGAKSHANNWLATGSALLTIGNPGFNVQANVGNSADQIPTRGFKDFTSYGGDVYWRDYAGSFGANVNFSTTTDLGALSIKALPHSYAMQSYGLFGQWFAEPFLTVEVKGGRFQEQGSGYYGGTGLVLYPYHDIALSLTYDEAKDQHLDKDIRDGVVTIEYLPVHDIPVSLYVGCDFAFASQLPHQQVTVLLLGINAYFGGGGRAGTLIDYQRNGPTNWDAPSPTMFDLGF